MQVESALRKLHKLSKAAADGDAAYRMLPQVFDESSGKIAHVDHRLERQAIERTNGVLGGRTGAAGDVIETNGAGDIDTPMDRCNPCRAGKGVNNAGGAENGQAAFNAKSRIPRLLRQFLTVGN